MAHSITARAADWLKKAGKRAMASPLGRQVKKIPAPIRKGYLAGLMVPVPGVAEAGALAGAGVWAKGAIERQVRRRTGEPYRMFGERPLPAGSLPHPAAGSSLFTSPARRLLGDLFPGDPCVRVIHLETPLAPARQPRYRETPEEELARDRRTLKKIAIGSLLAGGVAATIIHHGRVPKPVQALPTLPIQPAPVVPKVLKAAKVKMPKVGSLGPQARVFGKRRMFATPARRLIDFGDAPERDNLSKARDAAIIAGTGAVGAGGLYAGWKARQVGRRAGEVLQRVRENTTPQAVAREGLKLVKKKVRQKAVEYFPTFTKWGKSAAGAMKRSFEASDQCEVIGNQWKNPTNGLFHGQPTTDNRQFFATPAQRLGVLEFAVSDQLKTKDTKRYAGPLRVAAGVEEGYRANSKTPVDLPIGDMQVIKAAYRKAGDVSKWGGRGVKVVKDATDVVRGVPRERDASGRKKKREWEKSWAQEHAKRALIGAGILGYTVGMKRSPRFRAWNVKAVKAVRDTVNDYVPNAFEQRAKSKEQRAKNLALRSTLYALRFSTPAQRLGVTFLAAKPAEPERGSMAAGVHGALVGGGVGGYWGAASAASSPTADAYFGLKKRRAAREVEVRGHGDLAVSKRPAAPFKPGKFRSGERLARAEHEALFKLKKSVRTRALGGGLAGAALLGGASYAAANLGHSPEKKKNFSNRSIETQDFKTQDARAERRVALSSSSLESSSLASCVFFDNTAADAGWDVRDPRGRSARVFAPGSRQRVRREKSWVEEVGNERKLWKAGVIGTGVLAAGAGIEVGRHWPKAPVKAVPMPKEGLLVKLLKKRRKI